MFYDGVAKRAPELSFLHFRRPHSVKLVKDSKLHQDLKMALRSEAMSLVQLYIPTELARDSVAEIGDLKLIQFQDVRPQTFVMQT